MNICFLSGGFSRFAGIERVTSIVANELAERNAANVHTLSMVDNGNNVYPLSDKIRRSHFFEERCSMKLALCKGALRKTIHHIKKNKIDIIIACGVLYFPLACIAAKLTGIKSVCWEHTSPSSMNEVMFERQIRLIGSKFSNANVLISEAALNYYNQNYRNKNNWLIYNPADNNLFSDNTNVYDKNSHRLISVGRFSFQKNYPLLVEVASRILAVHDDWTWDIFGEGREFDLIKQLIEEKGLTEKVILRGTVPDLYERYSHYSAIVMTSRWEGFPMVLIEAAAKGLPMISYDVQTGPNEIIQDGVNGYLVSEYTSDKMARKIGELIENPALREKMSFNSKATAKRFCIDNTVAAWESLFSHLCGGKE